MKLRQVMLGLILLLPSCNVNPFLSPPPPTVSAVEMPPSLRPDDIVGRWGLAAYHREQDRARTIAAARDQCSQAYLIDRSPGGDILILGHDNPQPQEMIVKGSVEGKTYVGPGPYPGIEDREVVSFDGQVLILKWVNPEVAGRYGMMVLARCGPKGTPPVRAIRVESGQASSGDNGNAIKRNQ
jgi:hypothetical protein